MKIVAACVFVLVAAILDIGVCANAQLGEVFEFDRTSLESGFQDGDEEKVTTTANNSAVLKSAKKTTKTHRPAPASASAPPSDLLVQVGDVCSITRQAASSTGRYYYTLQATVGTETVAFTERPERNAMTVPTQVLVEQFADLFGISAPNAALTFAAAGESHPAGPLIVVLSHPRIVRFGGGSSSSMLDVEYTLEQTDSQRTVASIEQFVDVSGGACSIFIDALHSGICH